jgi:hypothetical protein
MSALGIDSNEIEELKNAINDDAHEDRPGIGKRTAGWLQKIGGTGLRMCGEVANAVATRWIVQYLGLG